MTPSQKKLHDVRRWRAANSCASTPSAGFRRSSLTILHTSKTVPPLSQPYKKQMPPNNSNSNATPSPPLRTKASLGALQRARWHTPNPIYALRVNRDRKRSDTRRKHPVMSGLLAGLSAMAARAMGQNGKWYTVQPVEDPTTKGTGQPALHLASASNGSATKFLRP